MRIALFLKDEKLKKLHIKAISALVIQISEDTIENVENHSLYSNNLNYVSLWLVRRQIDVIYLQNADNGIKDYFKRINVDVKTYDDLKENPVLNLFLL